MEVEESVIDAVDHQLKLINELEFDMVKLKIQDIDDGLGWNKTQCDDGEREYKRFLSLIAIYPEETIVPSKIMDSFWHFHILDTRKYYDDCNRIFGNLIHHYPYFGMNGPEDLSNLNEAFQNTRELYFKVFLTNMMSTAVNCGSRCSGKCSR